jgi:hypothetical protein
LCNCCEAEDVILKWQADQEVTATIVLLDQPTIVNNTMRQQNADFGSKESGRPATANEVGVPVRAGQGVNGHRGFGEWTADISRHPKDGVGILLRHNN